MAVGVALLSLATGCGTSATQTAPATPASATIAAPAPPPPLAYSSDPVIDRACTLAAAGDFGGGARVMLEAVPDSVLKAGGTAFNDVGYEAGRKLGSACHQFAQSISKRLQTDAGPYFTERYRANPSLLPTPTTTAPPATTAPPTTTTTRPPPTTTTKPVSPALVWFRGPAATTWTDLRAANKEKVTTAEESVANSTSIADRYQALADGVPRGDRLGDAMGVAFDTCADAWRSAAEGLGAGSVVWSTVTIKLNTCNTRLSTMNLVLDAS